MSFLAFTGLINFLTSITLGLFIIIKNPKSTISKIYIAFNTWIAIYSFGYFFWQYAQNETEALIWFKILTIGFIPLNVLFLHFVFYLLGIIRQKKKELLFYYFLNFIFILLTINSSLYSKVEPRFNLGYWPIPTIIFHIYLLFWFFQCFYGFFHLIRNYKLKTGLKREQIKYYTIAIFIGFLGGATNWPMWYNIHSSPYPNILISLYAILFTYSAIKHQVLDIKIVFTRGGIFLLLYFIILAIPFGIGYYKGFDIYSSIYLFIMATFGPFIYRYFQKKADALLLADQKKYQDFLYITAKNIVKLHDLDKLLETIVKIIVEAVKIEYAVVFINDKENSVYKLQTGMGNHNFPDDFTINKNEIIISTIKAKGKPFIDEDLNKQFNFNNGSPVQLIIPINFDNRLLGFLSLGEKLNRSFYTKDDYNAFEILADQAGLAIENCLILEEHKKFQERIFQTEKFSLLGGMAEGIAHTIKNRLQYSSVAASLLQVETDNFLANHKDLMLKYPDIEDSFNEFMEISKGMVKNIKRTDEIIHSIIKYARIEYNENSFSEFSLKEVVEIASNMVKLRHNVDDIALIVEINGSKPMVGIMSQILESLYNLMDNSYEAIEEKKRHYTNQNINTNFDPVIKIKQRETQDSYIIEAYDNGIGIKQEDKNKIFAPYFTTKSSYKTKSKPGVGMFVMERIIEEIHNGKIWYESEYLNGTTFYIELPKKRNCLTA